MPRKNRGICVFVSKFLNRLEEKIRKESRHPERSEGSPDEREIPHCVRDDELHQGHCGLTIQG